MTYEVYLDDKLLFYPNEEKFTIMNAVLDQSLNEAGTFECDIPADHVLYSEINERSSMIRVLKNSQEIFYGEVRETTQNFDLTKHIYAVGELAFLFDSIQSQYRFQGKPSQFFTRLITMHNNQVEEKKRFTVGSCQVSDPNDYILRYTNYEDTLTAIREKLCDSLNGYLRIRKENGTRYIDLVPLESYGNYCAQTIEFGRNLLELSKNINAADIATAVIPLGTRLETRTSEAVEGLDEKLTIKSVNDGKDYVYNESAVSTFGWVKVVKEWPDVTDPTNLKAKAIEWLNSTQYSSVTLELNALDLSNLNADIESFEIGDTVLAKAELFGMNTVFPIQKKTTHLNALNQNYIVLGQQQKQSYTKQTSNAASEIRSEIPEVPSIVEEARKNAIDLLTGENGGYVTFVTSQDEKSIQKILVTNAAKEADSTQKWEWSVAGLGHFYRDQPSKPWSTINLALTMDGKIVADRITSGTLNAANVNITNLNASNITSGTLSASKISGGTFKVGGNNNTNGKIEIYNASGVKQGEITLDGIDFDYKVGYKSVKSRIQTNNYGTGVFCFSTDDNPQIEGGFWINLFNNDTIAHILAKDRIYMESDEIEMDTEDFIFGAENVTLKMKDSGITTEATPYTGDVVAGDTTFIFWNGLLIDFY